MDKEGIANIKSLALDMITKAKSGHPGIVLSAAPIIYSLYKNHLNINPIKPDWYNRDRFILSAGHGSALLYATLYMTGYDISSEDLKNFRELNSKTPGHPEVHITPGVECSTGPLGQGVATAVGMALGEKILNSRFKINIDDSVISPIDFKTYVLVGDGDLMEGVSYEACSLAGTLCLNNLIILYDSNNMTLDGSTENTFKEDVCKRFEAMGFETYKVNDGNNLRQLNFEISKAKRSNKPAFIEIKTHLGYGSLLQDTNKVHGTVLTDEDLTQLKNNLKIPLEPFYVNETLRRDLIGFIANRVGEKYNQSLEIYDKYIQDNLDTIYKDFKFYFQKDTYDISNYNWNNINSKVSIRDINKSVLNEISNHISALVGGSADLNSSTKAYIDFGDNIMPKKYNAKNIWYGIREHAGGCISNGLALLGFLPFFSTFLTFSDYLKPAIRMSSLMNLPVTYIFTHDSITVGKDGPTHQPVEQLSTLRSIPNLHVYRPVDLKEIIGCWQSILMNPNNPSALIISRSEEIRLNNTSASKSCKGAYVLKEALGPIQGILIATGTEVITALKVAMILEKKHINLRVVSMPSVEIFEKQSNEYKKQVLPNLKTIVIEASNCLSFTRYTSYNYIININKFGKSADGSEVLKYMNFDIESIINKVINILNQ